MRIAGIFTCAWFAHPLVCPGHNPDPTNACDLQSVSFLQARHCSCVSLGPPEGLLETLAATRAEGQQRVHFAHFCPQSDDGQGRQYTNDRAVWEAIH